MSDNRRLRRIVLGAARAGLLAPLGLGGVVAAGGALQPHEHATLATLADAPFTKIRMCVFPKHYAYNENEPERYPFPCLARGSSAWNARPTTIERGR